MSLFDFTLLISGVIFLILTIDISRRKKMNGVHVLLFLSVGIGLLVFTIFPTILNRVGHIFGLQRGADLLVYSSILFLFYFMIQMFNKIETQKDEFTKLVREISIQFSPKKELRGKYAFVIPGYNEGKVINSTIQTLLDSGYTNIVFINDGSSDDTMNKVSNFGDKIIVLHHFKNRGQGAAIETGFEYVRRFGKIEFVVTFDSDGQHDIHDLKRFEDAFQKHPESQAYLGSRFLGTVQNISPLRVAVLKMGILFTWILSGIKLTDTHNGYRCIRTQALFDIKISIDGMGHASEILDIIASKHIAYTEVPVTITYTDYSGIKGQSSLNAINIVATMIWNKFFR